jgi:hypothetical protein
LALDALFGEPGEGGWVQQRKIISMAWLVDLPILAIDDEAQRVADALVQSAAMPAAAYADALHIGIAATNDIEIIAS